MNGVLKRGKDVAKPFRKEGIGGARNAEDVFLRPCRTSSDGAESLELSEEEYTDLLIVNINVLTP